MKNQAKDLRVIFDAYRITENMINDIIEREARFLVWRVKQKGLDTRISFLADTCGKSINELLDELQLIENVDGFKELAKKVAYRGQERLDRRTLNTLALNSLETGETLLISEQALLEIPQLGPMRVEAIKNIEVFFGIHRTNEQTPPIKVADTVGFLAELENKRPTFELT